VVLQHQKRRFGHSCIIHKMAQPDYNALEFRDLNDHDKWLHMPTRLTRSISLNQNVAMSFPHLFDFSLISNGCQKDMKSTPKSSHLGFTQSLLQLLNKILPGNLFFLVGFNILQLYTSFLDLRLTNQHHPRNA